MKDWKVYMIVIAIVILMSIGLECFGQVSELKIGSIRIVKEREKDGLSEILGTGVYETFVGTCTYCNKQIWIEHSDMAWIIPEKYYLIRTCWHDKCWDKFIKKIIEELNKEVR